MKGKGMTTIYLIDGVKVPKKSWDRAKVLGEVAVFDWYTIKEKEKTHQP